MIGGGRWGWGLVSSKQMDVQLLLFALQDGLAALLRAPLYILCECHGWEEKQWSMEALLKKMKGEGREERIN